MCIRDRFKKLKFHTHENLGYGEIYLPPEEMHTRSLVLLLPPESRAGKAYAALPEEVKGGVIARLGFLVKNVAPVFLLCDSGDIGVSERLKDPHFGVPCLYVYDKYPGGTGLAEAFQEKLAAILTALAERLTSCPCREGCPSCIGPVGGGDTSRVEHTKAALTGFLSGWIGG